MPGYGGLGFGGEGMSVRQIADVGPVEVSGLFPFELRQRLVRAAATTDPQERVRQIQAATDWGRLHYPECFREDAAPCAPSA